MTATRIAGVYVVLVGLALAGPMNDVWNADRRASCGFPGARVVSRLTSTQRQRLGTRSRLTRDSWLSALRQRGSVGFRARGSRLDGAFMVDTAIHSSLASTQQCNPSVAFDGNNYLVAWTAYLDTLFDVGVCAARITPAGVVLDTECIMIDSLNGLDPVIGFDGTNYLVVEWGATIQGFRVSPDGEVLDSTAIPVSSSGGWHQNLAFDGTNYLVVWEDYRDSVAQVYGARVSPSGAVLDTAGIAVGTGPSSLMCPAIAFDGTNFLVVWTQYVDSATTLVCGKRVSPDGQVLDSGFVVDSASQVDEWYGPTATSDGTNSLVVWHDFTLGMRGALVAEDGSVVDSGITIAPADVGYAGHDALYDGNDFLVTWKAWSPVDCILASRVSRSGVPLDTPGVHVCVPPRGFTDNPAVGFDGNRYLVTWDDDLYGCPNVYGARLTRQMSMLDSAGIVISRGGRAANEQHFPSAAFDGTNYLVAWTDNRNMSGAIYAARVSSGGTDLDPDGIPICTLGFHRDYASVAFDGTNYLVAWADGRRNDSADIYAARVTKGGSVLDPLGFPVAASGNGILPAVAFNGTNYLVVWDDVTDSGASTIRCARVSATGRVLDTAGITLCGEGSPWMPVVASNGTDWLAAWHDWRSGMNPGVYGARITSAGQVLDSGGFAIGAADEGEGCASLASDGTNYLALWERLDKSMLDVRGARISTTGALLDSFMVQPAADSYATSPSAGYDGTNYGVVWVDSSWGSTWAIYGARISPSGEVIGGTQVASSLAWYTYLPMVSMACGAGSQALCAYPCWTDDYQGRTYNTTRIWGKVGALSGVQEASAKGLPFGSTGTVVRGVLFLPAATSLKLQAASLLDISGRKVLELRPGANDVRALAPGVYFVRETQAQAQAIRKVVVTR